MSPTVPASQTSETSETSETQAEPTQAEPIQTSQTQAEPDTTAAAARGTVLNLSGSIFGALVGFVTVATVTNGWGRSSAGVFFATTALFTLAANGTRLGAEAGLTYYIARLRADGLHRRVPAAAGRALLATGSAATLVGGLGLVSAPWLAHLVTNDSAFAGQAEDMLRVLALAVPCFALTQAMLGASRGFSVMRPAVLVGNVVRPITQLVAVLVVLITTDSLVALAAAWAASALITTIPIGWWLRRRLVRVGQVQADPSQPGYQPAPNPGQTSPDEHRPTYRQFAAGRAGADLVSAALERLDVLLVAALLGEASAGLYGATGRLILAGQLIMIAAAQSTAPLLTASFAQDRNDEAQRLLRVVTAWNVTLLWPVFIALGFGAEPALSIFGPDFTEARSLLVVLAVAMAAVVAIGGGDTVLTATGDSFRSLVNHVVALAIMVGASLVLIPEMGLVGAGVAWASSRLTLRILATVRVWRLRGVHPIGRPVLLATTAAAAAYGPAGLLGRWALGDGWAGLFLTVGLGGLVHLVLLSKLRRSLDLDRLLAIVAQRAGRRQKRSTDSAA